MAFEGSPFNMPANYTTFLRNCAQSTSELVFAETVRILFSLIVQLGLAKNPQAPILFKSAIATLGLMEKADHIELMLQNFLQIMKDIPSLPAAPLAEPLLKLLDSAPTPTVLTMVRTVLLEGRIREVEKEELEEALVKLIFSDVNVVLCRSS
jgi:hypothetical protein